MDYIKKGCVIKLSENKKTDDKSSVLETSYKI